MWTGTDPDGTAADSENFCDDWTNLTNGFFGQTGASQATDANWTDGNQVFCNLEAHLFCFELDRSPAPALSRPGIIAAAVLI